jgi:hypothetical protein
MLRSYFMFSGFRINVHDSVLMSTEYQTQTRAVEVNTSRKRELVSACLTSEAARRISITFGIPNPCGRTRPWGLLSL